MENKITETEYILSWLLWTANKRAEEREQAYKELVSLLLTLLEGLSQSPSKAPSEDKVVIRRPRRVP
jgi:hypothetical protein